MLKYSKSPIDVSKVEDHFKICIGIQPARVINSHTHSRYIYDRAHTKVVFKERSVYGKHVRFWLSFVLKNSSFSSIKMKTTLLKVVY